MGRIQPLDQLPLGTNKVKYLWGDKFRIEKLKKPKRQSVNYSFIFVLEK